ncbi:MAG TPA: amylo-alpha-1,6-glucosidase [Miltoncostaea sp.]|nr:amylo-alpha-1,6-glucosidase [Miltoncostaea sp.]
MIRTGVGRQVLGDAAAAAAREWLVTDGLGGYAMGTAGGLETRRYHGLLAVATDSPGRRMMGLVALDATLVRGDARIPLATHEWGDGTLAPAGHVHLESFALEDGVPCWRWRVGDVVLERRVAMGHGRPLVAVVHRLLHADGPVRLEIEPLCTWRDVHGERSGPAPPAVEAVSGGFVFEGAYRVDGPGWSPAGAWWVGLRHREEAARGLADREDVWCAGRFAAELQPGGEASVVAWAGDLSASPPPAADVTAAAATRARSLAEAAGPDDDIDRALAIAADRFVVAGPTVVAGYPWFGEWARDALTSYAGLFLETGRADEGRLLLERAGTMLSEGMLANTTDSGAPEYNTVDGTLWLAHAVGRHVAATGDRDLAASLAPALRSVVEAHVAGTRYGIRVDPADGLLTQGARAVALTWMDARIDGAPVTPRTGKPVEVNALWIEALAVVESLGGRGVRRVADLHARARASFARRFVRDGRVLDVVDGPWGDDAALRPNALLAVALPHGPLRDPAQVRAAREHLLTSLGLRSLAPGEPGYRGVHRGGPAERDAAYHQGTVWPWLIGPYVEASLRTGEPVDGVLDGLEAHLGDWGLGSVSETADGDPPHGATGCPFQAWSVAEVLRARRLVRGRGAQPQAGLR